MKKKELAKMSDKQKIDYLIEKVDKIDKAVNPPLVFRFLRWISGHWFLLILICGLGYVTLNMWDEIQLLIQFVTQVNESVDTMKEGYLGIKTQATDITDKASGLIDKIPFIR